MSLEPTGGVEGRMLDVETRLRTEIGDIDGLLTTYLATAQSLAPDAAVSLGHSVSLVGTFCQETGIVADAMLGARQALGFADGRPVDLYTSLFWLNHSLSDSDGATDAPARDETLLDLQRERFEDGDFDFADSFYLMDHGTWHSNVFSGASLSGSDSDYIGGGALMGPDGKMYPIMVPRYYPDGRSGEVYTAGYYNIDPRTLGGLDPNWEPVGYETGTARFNDEASIFEKFFVGGYTWSGGEVTAGPSNAPLAYLEFDPRGQPRGNVTEPGMDLSSLDPGGFDITRYDSVDQNGQRVRVENTSASNRANFRSNVFSMVAAGGHAWHVVGNLDGGRVRAYEVHFEYNPVDDTRRATVTTFQPVDGGSQLQPAHIYLDESGDMYQIPVNYLAPEGEHVTGGSLVSITDWGDPTLGGTQLGHNPSIDVKGPES